MPLIGKLTTHIGMPQNKRMQLTRSTMANDRRGPRS
jgi:hypothetical protein